MITRSTSEQETEVAKQQKSADEAEMLLPPVQLRDIADEDNAVMVVGVLKTPSSSSSKGCQ